MKTVALLSILALASCVTTTETYTDAKGNVVTRTTRTPDAASVAAASAAANAALAHRSSK